jgi:glycosyltransferase involved in cell wall biosynthesis
MTSRTEQMPLSLLEAMGCGHAVVATDVGDVAAMVDETNRPFVRAGRDAAALADALAALRDDAVCRAALGAANRARALAEYSGATMVGRWRELFEEVASR